MERLFDIVVEPGDSGDGKTGVRLGIRCILAGETCVCPVSTRCVDVGDLEAEARKVRDDLDRALDRARRILEGGAGEDGEVPISDDMPAAELWSALEAMPDEASFVERFNGLEEGRRREVAEHVLTSCNVFSGRPAFFSSRYDAETALLGE